MNRFYVLDPNFQVQIVQGRGKAIAMDDTHEDRQGPNQLDLDTEVSLNLCSNSIHI